MIDGIPGGEPKQEAGPMMEVRISDSPLSESDVARIVCLLGDVIAAPGGIEEKRRVLMDGLCKLIDGSAWVWWMAGFDPDKPPSIIGLSHSGFDEERLERFLEAVKHPAMEAFARLSSAEQGIQHVGTLRRMEPVGLVDSLPAALFWKEANIGALMASERTMPGGAISAIVVCREFGRPDFDEREAKIAHLLLSEMSWLHLMAFPDQADQEIASIYPKHRTVLNMLCEGWSRKKIAANLGLSENTIHSYAKTIFKHFGVHSQAELITRFARGNGRDN